MDIHTIIDSLENAENDNKRFALLLILAQQIKSNKLDDLKLNKLNNKEEEWKKCQLLNEKLFSSINPHFLARLLITRQTTENVSPIVYKALGLSIMTQFLDYESLACDPILLSKLDVICNILVVADKDEENETNCDPNEETLRRNLCSDAFKYLFALSNFIPDHLCQNTSLLDILLNKIILNEKYRYSINSIETLLTDVNIEYNFQMIACNLFVNICKSENGKKNSSYEKLKTEKIEKFIRTFLNFIDSCKTEFKFCLVHYLNYFLRDESTSIYFCQDEKMNEESSKIIFSLLENLLKNKNLNKLIKQQVVFVLLDNFVRLFEFEYIYMKNRNFFYLIIHLLCVEIGLNLQVSDYDQDYKINNQLVETMSMYYSLMEQIIIILSTASPFDTNNSDGSSNDEEDDDTDSDSNQNKENDTYEPELKRAIKVIIECLETVLLFIKDNLDVYEKLNPNECILVASSVRLLSCWVAHENLLDEKFIDLTPKIIKFCEHHYSEFNASNTNKLQINVYDFVIPALQRILIDQKDKLQSKSMTKKKETDELKFEFEKTEFNENIENITKLLNECYIHTNISK